MGDHPDCGKHGLFDVLERLSQFAQRCRSKTLLSARLSRLSGSLSLSPITTQSPFERGARGDDPFHSKQIPLEIFKQT